MPFHAETSGPDRPGFTLIEFLVCLTITALVAALTIPVILAVRGSAQAVQCRSQLRNLGLAIHQFHNLHRRIPPGRLFGSFGTGPDSRAWSWIALTLPFLDQKDLYSRGGIPRSTLRASGIADQSLPLLHCPSDDFVGEGKRSDAGNMIEYGFTVGQSSYKAVSGSNWGADKSQGISVGQLETAWIHRGVNGSWDGLSEGDGLMFRSDQHHRQTFSSVTDGMSQTLMLGECLPQQDAYCSWPYSNNAYATCAIPLNDPGNADPFDWANNLCFRSRHSNGANFCYVDGRVRFVNQAIGLKLYRDLATICGSETGHPAPQHKASTR